MVGGALKNLKVIAFTHKTLPFEQVGKFHIAPEVRKETLSFLKETLELNELMYLSTCNRVEFVGVSTNASFNVQNLLEALNLDLPRDVLNDIANCAEVHIEDDAVKHLFKVSASLDSMVIGEREIITQVRKAFEECSSFGLTGDTIRLVLRKTIETAKTIFTETAVFKKPVSVVSLAFHKLRDLEMPADSRVLMVGAGKTNKAMARFLSKHGYKNIIIFNRSLDNAKALASDISAQSKPLDSLKHHSDGFDVLITCTSSGTPIVSKETFDKLVNFEAGKKVVIDLAIPGDVAENAIGNRKFIKHINIEELKVIAEKNLTERSREIEKCEAIIDHNLLEFHDLYKQREIEIAMRDIPRKVKEIKETAINEVYAKELNGLNPESREVLDKIVSYLEKKYISVPMKMAKEVMLGRQQK